MRETKAVKETVLPVEAHVTFINSFKTGTHDYSPADLSGKGLLIYTCKEDFMPSFRSTGRSRL